MTFETQQMPCLACNRPGLVAEVDKGGTLFLACPNEKCGMRIGAGQATLIRAEREARTGAGALVDVHGDDSRRLMKRVPARLE